MRSITLANVLLCACISVGSTQPKAESKSIPHLDLTEESAAALGITMRSDSSLPNDRIVTLRLSEQYFIIQELCHPEILLAVGQPQDEQIAFAMSDIAHKMNWGSGGEIELLLYGEWRLRLVLRLDSECKRRGLAAGRYYLTESGNSNGK